jgi:predicted RNase H-like HicB family nuclease
MAKRLEYCGSFNGTVTLRKGETPEQALQRVEKAMQTALDARKSLDVNIGVDFGDYTVIE